MTKYLYLTCLSVCLIACNPIQNTNTPFAEDITSVEYAKKQLQVPNETYPEFVKENFDESQHELIDALKELELVAKKHLPIFSQNLEQGNSPEKLAKLDQLLGALQLADDIKILYRWSNIHAEQLESVFAYPTLISLEDAYRVYNQTNDIYSNSLWSTALFPIGDQNAEHLLTSLSETPQISSPIYHYYHENCCLYLEYESVLAMVNTHIEAIETGALYLEDGYLEKNIQKFGAIQRKYSPRSYIRHSDDQRGYKIPIDEPRAWQREWRKYQTGSSIF